MSQGFKPCIAIVGATGAVGQEFLELLHQRDFPLSTLRLFASSRSVGSVLRFRDAQLQVEALVDGCFDGVDIALFSAGRGVSQAWAPRAVDSGAWVIDNSSFFRMDPAVPLIIPEVNLHAMSEMRQPGIIANPNCSTIIALMAVTPLHKVAGVKRMVISTYQSASGAGAAAMRELEGQAREFACGRPYTTAIFGRQYLFNCFSHNTEVGADGYNEEERKLLRETRKIWDDDSVRVSATCVRVPTLRAHCESINLTFDRPLGEKQAREILAAAPGVSLVDDRANNQFPEPIAASGLDPVLVGRIRADMGQDPGCGLEMFVAGDQIRKGAALNALQIAEALLVGQVLGAQGTKSGARIALA
ncbi:MAG: aspartate-semialdehyde dehydrogenase [Phycisphaerales bacterium]|nr:aspartate-semialdehyde dehydrogenase [Phycisphaerales bacterium]